MNLLNKTTRAMLLISAGIVILTSAGSLEAQGKKKKPVEIPAWVSDPEISEDLIEKHIEKFTEWVEAPFSPDIKKESALLRKDLTETQKDQLKQQKKQKKKKKDAESETTVKKADDFRIVYLNYVSYRGKLMSIQSLVDFPEMLDDIEEVTGVRRLWYQDLAKAANAIGPVVQKLTKARSAGNSEKFAEYFKEFKEAGRAYKAALKSRKPRLDQKSRDFIMEKNIRRRKAAYLAKLKQEEEAKKKAAAAKSNKSEQKNEGSK